MLKTCIVQNEILRYEPPNVRFGDRVIARFLNVVISFKASPLILCNFFSLIELAAESDSFPPITESAF